MAASIFVVERTIVDAVSKFRENVSHDSVSALLKLFKLYECIVRVIESFGKMNMPSLDAVVWSPFCSCIMH